MKIKDIEFRNYHGIAKGKNVELMPCYIGGLYTVCISYLQEKGIEKILDVLGELEEEKFYVGDVEFRLVDQRWSAVINQDTCIEIATNNTVYIETLDWFQLNAVISVIRDWIDIDPYDKGNYSDEVVIGGILSTQEKDDEDIWIADVVGYRLGHNTRSFVKVQKVGPSKYACKFIMHEMQEDLIQKIAGVIRSER